MGMGRKTVREPVTVTPYSPISNILGLDPPDNVLKESLEQYAQEGLTRAQKLARLGIDHSLHIG